MGWQDIAKRAGDWSDTEKDGLLTSDSGKKPPGPAQMRCRPR